jgi:hypothetical protein
LPTAARLGLALAAALAAYFLVYRPLQINWGATPGEISRIMPGDEIVNKPVFDATRVVTIDAPPDAVWP